MEVERSSGVLRIIPRLDIKGKNLIKGINLEGLRKLGDPRDFARKYYNAGADELILMDVVASLYGRNNLSDTIKKVAENIFIPITVGGGLRVVEDIKHILRCGADKAAINTAAIDKPSLITEAADMFGSQCIVVSIEAKKISEGLWEAYTNNGREKTGKNAVEWAIEAASLGAGEILLTSVDREGTRKGYDIELVKAITEVTSIPIVVSGGMGSSNDIIELVADTDISGASIADVLHYNRMSLHDIKEKLFRNNISVRGGF